MLVVFKSLSTDFKSQSFVTIIFADVFLDDTSHFLLLCIASNFLLYIGHVAPNCRPWNLFYISVGFCNFSSGYLRSPSLWGGLILLLTRVCLFQFLSFSESISLNSGTKFLFLHCGFSNVLANIKVFIKFL